MACRFCAAEAGLPHLRCAAKRAVHVEQPVRLLWADQSHFAHNEVMLCVTLILRRSIAPPSVSTGSSLCLTRPRSRAEPDLPALQHRAHRRECLSHHGRGCGFRRDDHSIETKEDTLAIRGSKQTKVEEGEASDAVSRASPPAPSSAASSSPTTSRSRVRRSRTASCTSIWSGDSGGPEAAPDSDREPQLKVVDAQAA